MQQQNRQDENTQQADSAANKGHSGQGIDKAPGEETAQDNVNFSQEAFKGKKVDADLDQEQDKPASQSL